jgi:hypothetical protein
MGWWDSHLHAFRVANPSHGEEDLIGIPDEDRFEGDPEHEEYDDTLTWVGGSYDPGLFNPEKVRFDDPRKRWKKAFAEP